MKKILFGSAAAICTVIGLSAFKTKTAGNWFHVNVGVNKAKGGTATFLDANVSHLTGDPGSCTETGSGKDCVVTFDSSQLTAGLAHIHTVVAGQGRAPLSTVYTRN